MNIKLKDSTMIQAFVKCPNIIVLRQGISVILTKVKLEGVIHCYKSSEEIICRKSNTMQLLNLLIRD